MSNEKILIIDDDKNVCDFLRTHFEREGFTAIIANDGAEGIDKFNSSSPDMIILDIMMPLADGWQVCKEIRKNSDTPIIMLTAKGEVIDKILGLELGADDYIVKPFDVKEVLARVKAVLRRCSKNSPAITIQEVNYDKLSINLTRYVLKANGKVVEAPPKEIELLYCLASHPNILFTRDQLLDNVWGFDYYGDSRTIDVHIKRLRAKLCGLSDRWEITTVWGKGYKFELKEDDKEN